MGKIAGALMKINESLQKNTRDSGSFFDTKVFFARNVPLFGNLLLREDFGENAQQIINHGIRTKSSLTHDEAKNYNF